MPPHKKPPWTIGKIVLVGAIVISVAFWVLIGGAFFYFFRGEQPSPPPPPVEAPNDPFIHRPTTLLQRDADPALDPALTPPSPPPLRDRPAIKTPVPTGPLRPTQNTSRTPDTNATEVGIPAKDLFEDAFVPVVFVQIPPAGIAALRRSPRKYVTATLREGDTIYTNVAIRLKGGPGSFRPFDDHPAFTVNFDKFVKNQTFHGLKKIHLNNSVQDNSYISEKISRELFNAAGVPTPRAGNAIVTVNGRRLGLYVLVEGINKQFLRQHFSDPGGNVYDGHSGSEVTQSMPVNSGDKPSDHSQLRALARAIQHSNLDTRRAAIESTLDVDRFLSYMAMETFLWHWDGYCMHRNNFRVFHDRAAGRMVFIPQGLDQILGQPNGPIFPETGGAVARAVLEIPQFNQRYRARMADLSTNLFRADVINARLREVADRVAVAVENEDPGAVAGYRQRVRSLGRRFQQRSASLQKQLRTAPPVPRPAELPSLSLADWQPTNNLGISRLSRESPGGTNVLLHISTTNGCTASWRTKAMLPVGKYQFEARLKTHGVVLDPADPRAGAGLRVSRHRIGQKNSGDRDWTPVTFDFEVRDEASEVELVCELRANQGTVWFDVNSFRLRAR